MPKQKTRHTRTQWEEDHLEQSYRRIAPSRKRKKKQSKTAGLPAIVAICVTVILIAVVITVGCIYFSNADSDGTILENVSVAGVDVGGMTQAQAIDTVRAATEKTYTKQTMSVTVLDSHVEIPPETSGASLNIKAAVRAAYKYGRTGSASRKQSDQETAMTTGYAVDITQYLNLDTAAIKNALAQLGNVYSSTLSQSTYEVTGIKPDQTLVVQLGVPEYGLDLNELYDKVLDAYNRNHFFVTGECGMIEPDPIDLEAILENYYVPPVDASFAPGTYDVIEGIDGYGFDIEDAKTQLVQAKYGTTVKIPFTAIAPEVTATELTALLYRDKLATYTASHTSDKDRDTNLRLACEAINGMILYPGDVFSYNEALGERTAAKGYKLGPSYEGDETVKTIGGGICQVSSGLYYCAMVSDLEILVRDNHGFAPSYVPLGMDATVSWGSIDFRFRNNTDYPIRIDASASEGSTTITLIGTDTKDYYVKMEYEILSTYNYTTSYKTMSASNAQGYRDGEYITEPFTGYDIKTYRCKYNKLSDTLISKDLEATSSYRKRDAVVCKIEGSSSGNTNNGTPLPGIGNGGVSDEIGLLPD